MTVKITKSDKDTSRPTMRFPALAPLYFSSDEPARARETEEAPEGPAPSLRTLPPELLHVCLAEYADWGDLAKLACVQSRWRDVVGDAAEFGGRDATWELSMALLQGGEETGEGDDEEAKAKNCRGMRKNEALAVKYLTRLSGVKVDETQLVQSLQFDSTDRQETKSVLPDDWQSSRGEGDTGADEAALLQLANCYLAGTGVSEPSSAHALHYLQSAYHLTNSVRAAHKLALIYERPAQANHLVPVDVPAAFEWFRAAAERGHVPSMAELALCYELGCGVARSDEAALGWYRRAAGAGHPPSHYSVGEHFEEGRGARMDREEACLWYWRAAVLGEEDGAVGLRRLEEVARRVVPGAVDILNGRGAGRAQA